ncbi:MAG: hypothetical protein HIU93_16005 [Acidobacteria bacterium]|nr:hypothetical protein [Acidobacteriota bacterium]
MGTKLSSNRNLREAVTKFLIATEGAACRNTAEVQAAMRKMATGQNASRMVEGVVFDVDGALQKDSLTAAQTISRSLGPKISDESSIVSGLWQAAAKRLVNGQPTAKEAAVAFLNDVEQRAALGRRYIVANHLIHREPGIQKLEVGPVQIIDGSLVVDDLNASHSNDRWMAELREPGLTVRPDGAFSVGVPINTWVVTVTAARENLAEEAAWLAGVATSLLRLTAMPSLGPFVRSYGEIEPHPFSPRSGHNDAITSDHDGVSSGGWSMPTQYVISPTTVNYCGSEEFKTIADQVFGPAKKSLAKRVSQGLGWLARGRRSEDRAERFLFFFTAIEALLSSDDKTAPLVQTISRHAASILTDDHGSRAKNAKLIKDLYAFRSALVHSGTRDVSKRQSNTAEHIAHYLFWRVLDQCDLGQTFEDFQRHLEDCSYGAPWGDDEIHHLGSAPRWPAPPPPSSLPPPA